MDTAKKRGRKSSAVDAKAENAAAEDVEEDEPADFSISWEQDFKQWEEDERQEGDWAKYTLYRRRQGAGKMGREIVWEWNESPPSRHEIGLEFGGGPYTIYMQLPPKNSKSRIMSRNFILAETYTEKKKLRDREQGLLPAQWNFQRQKEDASPARNPMEDIAMIFDKMVLPMMAMLQKNQAPAQNPMDLIPGMAGVVNQIVLEGAKSNIRTAKMLQEELMSMKTTKAEEEEKDPEADDFDWKDFLKDAIKEYGPKLIEATGLKEKFAAADLRSNEIFQTLAQNKSLFDRVYGLLMQDPEVDKTLTEKVLQKMVKMGLGFNVKPAPASAPINGQTPGRVTAVTPNPVHAP